MKIKFNNNALFFLKGRTYEAKRNDSISFDIYYDIEGEKENVISITETVLNKWLKNGYIEEVKEVSYAYSDVWDNNCETFIKKPSTDKQQAQMQAFAKLTHVRARILKDYGYSEDWKPKQGELISTVLNDVDSGEIYAQCANYYYDYGTIFFPQKLAELALKDNQELFKTYLCV